jgi:hypothetical protein
MKKSQKWKHRIKNLILPKGKKANQIKPKEKEPVYKGGY